MLPAIIFMLFAASFISCEKYKNPLPDFQNTLPTYVQVTNKASRTVKKSASYTIALTSLYALGEDITINYELKGLANTAGSIVMPKGLKTVTINLTAPDTPQTVMFHLTGTSSPTLTVGKLSPASEVVKITVTP